MKIFRADRIRERRKELGLTLEGMARRADVTLSHIIQLEQCRKIPRVNTLAKIADALNVNMDYFFEEKEG